MKKKLSLLLAAAMAVSALAGCGPRHNGSASSASASGSASAAGSAGSSQPSRAPEVNFMVLSGPTGVGAAWLIDGFRSDSAPADAPFVLNTTVAAENTEVTNALVNGDADIAAIATNVAANLAAKTDGGIQVLAVNTLGVLYILEKGDAVRSMADLKGRTLYAPSTAKGANPEYILNYLLRANGVDPSEVDIQWMTPQEITAQITSSDAGVCMLPVPAATALLMKDSGVREALSLSDEWDKLNEGALPMGCVVARADFLASNPELADAFLELYGDSISFMSDEGSSADASALVAKYGITANEQIAARAIPRCNLTLLTGAEMKETLEGYYQVLFQADPASIGGAMPYDSFYYGVE